MITPLLAFALLPLGQAPNQKLTATEFRAILNENQALREWTDPDGTQVRTLIEFGSLSRLIGRGADRFPSENPEQVWFSFQSDNCPVRSPFADKTVTVGLACEPFLLSKAKISVTDNAIIFDIPEGIWQGSYNLNFPELMNNPDGARLLRRKVELRSTNKLNLQLLSQLLIRLQKKVNPEAKVQSVDPLAPKRGVLKNPDESPDNAKLKVPDPVVLKKSISESKVPKTTAEAQSIWLQLRQKSKTQVFESMGKPSLTREQRVRLSLEPDEFVACEVWSYNREQLVQPASEYVSKNLAKEDLRDSTGTEFYGIDFLFVNDKLVRIDYWPKLRWNTRYMEYDCPRNGDGSPDSSKVPAELKTGKLFGPILYNTTEYSPDRLTTRFLNGHSPFLVSYAKSAESTFVGWFVAPSADGFYRRVPGISESTVHTLQYPTPIMLPTERFDPVSSSTKTIYTQNLNINPKDLHLYFVTWSSIPIYFEAGDVSLPKSIPIEELPEWNLKK
ncbi:MAG: hypothetical protein QM758_13395 [Armatimonas sp.]